MQNDGESYDLIDAIFFAKHILGSNPKMLDTVQFDRQKLGNEKFTLTKRVKKHTCVSHLIPYIKNFLRQHTGLDVVKIEFGIVDTSSYGLTGSRLAGIMGKKSPGHYIILLHKGETYCTQRLALCKELAQIFVSCITSNHIKPLNPHKQIVEATRELIEQFYSGSNKKAKLTDKFESDETFAHAIALELMMPYPIRAEIQELLNDGKKDDVSKSVEIANRLLIPVETAEEYCQTYFDITTPIYDLIK